jgi:predicted secreted Zn-dependent protease
MDGVPCNAKSTTMVQSESGNVATTVTYACYDVVGETAAAIRANINGSAARPRDTAGVAHDATTTWRYRLTWSTISTPEGCRAANITPSLTIDYIFPRWVNNDSPTSPLATRWAAYVSALIVHEQGHQDLSVVTTADAISRLKGVVAPCVEFQSAAQAQIDAATDAGRQRERDYDLQTRHGATQGATFP